jgi:hypothetical protein
MVDYELLEYLSGNSCGQHKEILFDRRLRKCDTVAIHFILYGCHQVEGDYTSVIFTSSVVITATPSATSMFMKLSPQQFQLVFAGFGFFLLQRLGARLPF